MGIGFAMGLMTGVVVGLSADHFQPSSGQILAVGMLATDVATIALLATAAGRAA